MIIISLIIAVLVAVIDQVIKYFVVQGLQGTGVVSFIPGILDLTYVENKGVAFGMFTNLRWFFVAFVSVVIVLFLVLLIKNKGKSKVFSIACALIIGGGLGNLIDRIFLGYVVDYLALTFFPPVCNFADYCITAGTILLIVYLLFIYKPIEKKKALDGEDSN